MENAAISIMLKHNTWWD